METENDVRQREFEGCGLPNNTENLTYTFICNNGSREQD